MAADAPAKSLWYAYLLWMVGGLFGWHLWYLERDAQAAMYMTSFGCFGFGALFDVFLIPGYVEEANKYSATSNYVAEAKARQWQHSRGFSFVSVVGHYVMSWWYTALLWFLSTKDYPYIPEICGVALATWALDCGRKTWGKTWSRWYIIIIGYYLMSWSEQFSGGAKFKTSAAMRDLIAMVQLLLVFSSYTRPEWEPSIGRRSGRARAGMILTIMAACCIVMGNVQVTDDEGNTHSLYSVFSVAGKRFKVMFDSAENMGWEDTFKTFASAVRGEEDVALETLGLSRGATTTEIRKAYRKLTKEFHPDSNPDAPKEKMTEINKAYETLNKLYKIRGQRI